MSLYHGEWFPLCPHKSTSSVCWALASAGQLLYCLVAALIAVPVVPRSTRSRSKKTS
jgi:hypothetical protein